MAGTYRIFQLLALALFGSALTAFAAPLSSPQTGGMSPPLSDAELTWIAGHREVLVGFSESFPPYSQLQPDGKMEGIDLDYLKLIAERTGLAFTPVVFNKWSQAETALKEGRIDLVTGLLHTPQREAYLLFSRSYLQAPNVMVTRIGMPYVLNEAGLRGLSVGLVHGFASSLMSQENLEAIHVVEFDNIHAVFEALSRGTIDATITDIVNAAFTIKSMHLTNLRMGSVIGGPGDTYFGVTLKKPELKTIIDKAINTIASADRRVIDERWVAVESAPSKWLLAFKWTAGLAISASVIFVLVFLHNRRLTVELNERKRIQLQLEETHAKLARVSEEKSEVLRIVAHDLRSPLTGLGLAAEILLMEKKQLSLTSQEILPKMLDSIRLMRRMVDDLVDVHLLEEGHKPYELNEVDLNPLVRKAVDAFMGTAGQKRINLVCQLPAAAVLLNSNERALRQVLDNLISNALKYSPSGSEVRVELTGTTAGCRLRICDQGPGVKAAEKELIFEKYGRGSAPPTGGEKSTGLGLWIVRRIVQSLEGKVWHEPVAGSTGSVFVVELPLLPAQSELKHGTEDAPAQV